MTEADWESWRNEDFQPYIDVSGTFIMIYFNILCNCVPSWSIGALWCKSKSLFDCQLALLLCCNSNSFHFYDVNSFSTKVHLQPKDFRHK